MNLISACTEFKNIVDKISDIEELLSDLKKEKDTLAEQICEESAISMTDHITISGFKFSIGYKNEYYPQYTKSDHSKKVELFKRIQDMNYELKVDFFETADITDHGEIFYGQTANIHKTQFEKFMNSLPAEIVAKFVDDGLLFVKQVPAIIIRKVKS